MYSRKYRVLSNLSRERGKLRDLLPEIKRIHRGLCNWHHGCVQTERQCTNGHNNLVPWASIHGHLHTNAKQNILLCSFIYQASNIKGLPILIFLSIYNVFPACPFDAQVLVLVNTIMENCLPDKAQQVQAGIINNDIADCHTPIILLVKLPVPIIAFHLLVTNHARKWARRKLNISDEEIPLPQVVQQEMASRRIEWLTTEWGADHCCRWVTYRNQGTWCGWWNQADLWKYG